MNLAEIRLSYRPNNIANNMVFWVVILWLDGQDKQATLPSTELVKIFSHSEGCLFVLLTVSFVLQRLFSFKRSHLFIISLSVCATGIIFRKGSPLPMHWRLLPTFSSIRFSVARFILRSLIHLDLSFVHGGRYGSIFSLLQADIQLCQHHLLKILSFFPLYNFSFSVSY